MLRWVYIISKYIHGEMREIILAYCSAEVCKLLSVSGFMAEQFAALRDGIVADGKTGFS